MILNAVYFKGSWKHQFDVGSTVTRDFHFDSNEVYENVKSVPTMNIYNKFSWGAMEDGITNVRAKFIELPYKVSIYLCFDRKFLTQKFSFFLPA